MKRNQPLFQKFQPSLKSLRASLNPSKYTCQNSFLEGKKQTVNQQPSQLMKQRSLSKSKSIVIKQKFNIQNLRFYGRNNAKSYFYNNQLDINFNKICQKSTASSELRPNHFNLVSENSINIETIEIVILFVRSTKNSRIIENLYADKQNQLDGGKSDPKIKMTITCSQLSIQDQTKVKRTYDISLIDKLYRKSWLRINIDSQLTPYSLCLNGIHLIIQHNFNKDEIMTEKTCQLSPWQLINQRKLLLQNKILSERSKSKIKWNLQRKENITPPNEQLFKQKTKTKETQKNYGITSPKQSAIKQCLRFRNKTNLLTTNKRLQKSFQNPFNAPIRQVTESYLMRSNWEPASKFQEKQKQSFYIPLTKRKNSMVPSLNSKQKRSDTDRLIGYYSISPRPKSSFKNLKDKNNYFQMRQSERKKSLKKSLQSLDTKEIEFCFQEGEKSDQIKQEYGIV